MGGAAKDARTDRVERATPHSLRLIPQQSGDPLTHLVRNAIDHGIETISIADVNDTALLVAKAKGRTEHVLVFDDHVDPNAYWPVFVALTA